MSHPGPIRALRSRGSAARSGPDRRVPFVVPAAFAVSIRTDAVHETPAHADPVRLRVNKLELLERLADDLAHDIKNPLHSMVINLEVLRRRAARVGGDEGDDLQRYAGVLSTELERVNRRIELLLRLSRPARAAELASLSDVL